MSRRGILTTACVLLMAPLNGISWTAKIDVPAEDVAAPPPPEF